MSKRKKSASSTLSETCFWSLAMDEVLLDAFLHQQSLGNKLGDTFTPKAYDNILRELKEHFPEKPLDKTKIKDHVKHIKGKWKSCYDLFKNGVSGFAWNPITNTWIAEPEEWKKLIEAKPRAGEWLNKPIPFYDKLVQLYGQDKVTREDAETKMGTRPRRNASRKSNYMETVNDIDHLVSNNEAALDSFDIVIAEDQNLDTCDVRSDTGQDGASFGNKMRNCRAEKDDAVMEKFIKSLENMVESLTKCTSELVKCNQRHLLSEKEIWNHLEDLGVEESVFFKAYLFLIQNLDAQRAFIGSPVHKRKKLLMFLMSTFGVTPNI